MAAVKIGIFSDIRHTRKNFSKRTSLRPLQSILQDFAVLGFSAAPVGSCSLLECQSHRFFNISHDQIRCHCALQKCNQ